MLWKYKKCYSEANNDVKRCYTHIARGGFTQGTVNYIDCEGLPQEITLDPSGNEVASFCADPFSITTTGEVLVNIIENSCIL